MSISTRRRARGLDNRPAGNPIDPRFDPLPSSRRHRPAVVALRALTAVAAALLVLVPAAGIATPAVTAVLLAGRCSTR